MTGAGEKTLDLRAIFGLTATITESADETGGASVTMDVTVQPGSMTNVHRHPGQQETYEVIEGTLDVLRDGTWHPLSPGESYTIPENAVHAFRNSGMIPARFINTHRPALGFQKHLETLDHLAREGKVKGMRDPRSLAWLSLSATTYKPDVSVNPPQKIVDVLGWIARRLGMKLPDLDNAERPAR